MVQENIRINGQEPANLYLFFGEENFKKRNYKEQLRKAVAASDSMNYSYFEGKDTDLAAVYDSVVTLPFFAARKLVILENTGLLKAAKKKASSDSDGADEGSSAGTAMLLKIIEDLPETTVLAIFESEVNKTLKVYKSIDKKGVVCQCGQDSRETVIKWLLKGFTQAGKRVRRSTLELLIDRVGTEYDRLRLEYEKIIGYAGPSEEITDNDILAVTGLDVESKIFDMLGAISNGNRALAMEKYYELLANREHPLYILAMIRMQFRSMLQISDLAARGYSDYDIADALGKKPFVVEKTRRYLRYFDNRKIQDVMDRIADTDMKIKTGDLTDSIGVELLIAELSGSRNY